MGNGNSMVMKNTQPANSLQRRGLTPFRRVDNFGAAFARAPPTALPTLGAIDGTTRVFLRRRCEAGAGGDDQGRDPEGADRTAQVGREVRRDALQDAEA